MRIHRSPAFPAATHVLATSLLVFGAALLPAQEPPAEAQAPPPPPVLVIEAGTVHPVGAPPIRDGVVVVRGERIAAVGRRGEVEIPADAAVRSFPDGHVYPGLVDAHTDAFTDASLRGDGGSDGGTAFVDDLRPQHDRSDQLVQAGITTAYVTVRSPATVRGQGAVVRPQRDGFAPWTTRDRAALQVRMTSGQGPSHPLQRQQQLQAVDALFEGLDDYRKAKADHAEARKKYEKDFADYLAFHEKKKNDAGGTGGDRPAEPRETERARPADEPGPGRTRRGNRGEGPPRDGAAVPIPAADGPTAAELEVALATLFAALAQDPPPRPTPPTQDPPRPQGQGGEARPGERPAAGDAAKSDEPKRPTWPKAVPPDPQKDALLRVVDGELPLRVEAHRPDEIRAALRLQRDRAIPVMVLEQAYGAAGEAAAIARQGVAVVLTETLPAPWTPPYDEFDAAGLPAKLDAAGVPFALASGSGRAAAVLPLAAAAAVGRGLSREAALRAITLTPAEILGVARDTGSLQAGKYADLLVCDRPLFASDSRVLLVLAMGRTEHEAK